MDMIRKQQEPTLVCTCNDLYIDDIEAAIENYTDSDEYDYFEVFTFCYTKPRCCECEEHVDSIHAKVVYAQNPQKVS